MPDQSSSLAAARFLRTLRVATRAALAHHDLTRGRRERRTVAAFTALAAKGADEWRFPAEGLASADGLVLATLVRDPQEADALILQAQGATGLAFYADRAVGLRFVSGQEFEALFDRDGRLSVALEAHGLSERDLAGFEIDTGEAAS